MVLNGAAVQRGQNGVTDPLIQEQTSECLMYSSDPKHATIKDTDEHSFNLTFKGWTKQPEPIKCTSFSSASKKHCPKVGI